MDRSIWRICVTRVSTLDRRERDIPVSDGKAIDEDEFSHDTCAREEMLHEAIVRISRISV